MAIRIDDVLIDDDASNISVNGLSANIRAGGGGADGDLLLFRTDGDRGDDATATVALDGENANLRMGGNGADGDLLLFRTDSDRTDDARATVHLDGENANLRMGGNGADGDLLLFRTDGNRTDDATATVSLDGENANLRMGGNGADGDLLLFRTDGDRTDDATATVHLDGENANLRMGGSGVDGDILLFPDGGDRTDDATATIHLNGNSGDIILQNADCAEEFDIGEKCDAPPGSVVVLTDEGRVGECGRAYDKRVVGIVSGAGVYRPAIVLDRQAGRENRAPVALMGKVYCRVDARLGAIEVGDMLTTSTTRGHAMKAGESALAFGAIVGKALQPLHEGVGLIPVLVVRQ
jgi:hypothetical protein